LNAGDPEESRTLVDHLLDCLGVHSLVLEEVEDDAGVERACTCPHRQAVDRGETHGGGDAAPPINSAHAGAVTGVGDYDFFLDAIGHELGQCRNDVFI